MALPSRCPHCGATVHILWSGALNNRQSRPVKLVCRACDKDWSLPIPASAVMPTPEQQP